MTQIQSKPTPLTDPYLVDRHEAARLLSISVRTLDQLVADREVPTRKIRGRRVFNSEALRLYAAGLIEHHDEDAA